MPKETQPHQQIPGEFDTNDDQVLIGNIVRIYLETESSQAISAYFKDILADTEGAAPASERLAAFELLAAEQRRAVEQDIISAGDQMLNNLERHNRSGREELDSASGQIRRSENRVTEDHTAVEQQLRRANARGADYAQEEVERTVRHTLVPSVLEYQDDLKAWAAAQHRETADFSAHTADNLEHLSALEDAHETVQPDYEDESKDVSRVIDDTVIETVTATLVAAIKEAQSTDESPEDAVRSAVESSQDSDDSRTALMSALLRFADENDTEVDAISRGFTVKAEEADQLLREFTSRGRVGYAGQHPEDIAGIYRRQKKSLEDVFDVLIIELKAEAATFNTIDDAVKRLRQLIAAQEN